MSFIIIVLEKAKKVVQFKENADVNLIKNEPEDVKIDEQKINRLMHLLHEADPTNPEKDTEEMLNLESMYWRISLIFVLCVVFFRRSQSYGSSN